MAVQIPARADQPVALRVGGTEARFSLEGAPAVAFAARAGGWIADAEDRRIEVRTLPSGVEDWVGLQRRPSKPLRYRVALAGVAGLRRVAGIVELLDATGAPVIRVGPAYLVDARGRTRSVDLSLPDCAHDENERAPWGRPVTAPGAESCSVELGLDDGGLEYPLRIDPPWTAAANNMAVAREKPEALRLADGRVLVVAGSTSAVAELYDPATRSWAATGAMTTGRSGAAAALLADGRGLVTGGDGLSSAELYDPATGKFTATGNMKAVRSAHTATALTNGKVLITGGWDAGSVTTKACDLYDPSSGAFASTGALALARARHTATLLKDGRVLAFGDWNAGTPELYNPTTGTWSNSTGGGTSQDHTATLLADGRVLFVGGRSGGGLSTTDYVGIFNPASGWSAGTKLPGPISKRRSHGAALLPDGRVAVMGGTCDWDCATLVSYSEHDDGQLYGTAGSWTGVSAKMSLARRTAVAVTLQSGNVLVVGNNGVDTTTEELCFSQGCACNVASECYTGFCVDGVCCDSACTGTCRACTKALKNQGVDGACGDIAADADPQSECAASAATTCGLDGMCDGKGACRKHVAGTACGPSSCIDSTSEVHADACDGNGTCVKSGSGPCKAGYVCKNDACKTSCDDKTDCAPGYECLAGSCSLRPNGAPCTDAGQCTSGHCIGSVCCDTACDGQCEACSELGKVGTCSPFSGDPTAKGKTACGAGEGPCGSTCNGADPKKCVYPGKETKCSASGTACDGTGKCVLTGAQCSPDGSESTAEDGTKTACGAYRCDTSSGECRTSCTVAADCQLSYACEGKKCVKRQNDASGDDGGCSTSGAQPTRSDLGFVLGCLGMAYFSRRRRAIGVAIGASLGALGCSSGGSGSEPAAGEAPALRTEASLPALDALRARFGERALMAGEAGGFVRAAGALIPDLPALAQEGEGRARVRLPLTAAEPLAIEDVGSGISAEVGLEGATRAPASLSQGLAVYARASGEGDLVLRAGPRSVEDFVSIPRRGGAPRLAYRVKLHGVAGLRLVENQLELLDASGTPRLRVDPPSVIDARGGRHRATLDLAACAVDRSLVAPFGRAVTRPGADECRMLVTWNDELDYPVLVDPTWTTTAGFGDITGHATTVLQDGTVLLARAGQSSIWNGAWAASGAMQVFRTNPTATTLPDGRVLVTGGGNSSAEIWNPTTGSWTSTGSMSASRSRARANLLSDGSVLVTCGDAAGTAERWVAGSFSSAGSTGKARNGHTATTLADGRVLVVGGVNGTTNDKSTRIYTLGSGWAAGPNTVDLRQNHIAGLLSTGKVLVAGGEDIPGAPGAIATVELYDPATNQFTAGTSMPAPERLHIGVVFGLGTKVYSIGGRGGGAGAGTSTWIYDVASGNWSDGGNLQRPRFQHTAELRPNGVILVVGGSTNPETLPPSETQCVDYGCACSAAVPCLVGTCVDGFCCKTACNAPCQACSAALKGGGKNGDCGAIPDGSDPDNDCATQPASSCGTIGSCNGTGSCRLYAAGTECAAPSCAQPTVGQPASTCDGTGNCVAPATVSCNPGYACVGTACATTCTTATDCTSGYVCKNGECKKKANGDTCTDGAECTSGFCVDGVCCDQDCTGQCEACNQTGTPGLCVPVSGSPVGTRPACGGTAPCEGTCSGTNPDACTFPSAACGEGKVCSNGECIQNTAVCVDDDTASQPANGPKTQCNPYRCDPATGTCRTSCKTASDCVLGSGCYQGQCKGTGAGGSGGADGGVGATGGGGSANANSSEDGGCGCRSAGSGADGHASLALSLVLAGIGMSRRKERRRAA